MSLFSLGLEQFKWCVFKGYRIHPINSLALVEQAALCDTFHPLISSILVCLNFLSPLELTSAIFISLEKSSVFSSLLVKSHTELSSGFIFIFSSGPWMQVKFVPQFVTLLSSVWWWPPLFASHFFFPRTFTKIQDCSWHCWGPTQILWDPFAFSVCLSPAVCFAPNGSTYDCFGAIATALSAHTESWKYLGIMFSGVALSQWQLGAGVWKPASWPPVRTNCEL